MNAKVALPILFLLGLTLDARAEGDKQAFKIVRCDVLEAQTAAVAFRNDQGQGRYITFMDAYREFKVGGTGNTAFKRDSLKGVLEWNKVTTIRTVPTNVPGMAGQMRIEYRHDGSVRMIDLGLIDEPCLTALKKRYASQLNFQPN
jgi:hypothetical protein